MVCIDRALTPLKQVPHVLTTVSSSLQNSFESIHGFAMRRILQAENLFFSSLDTMRTKVRNWSYAFVSDNLSALILLSIYEYPLDKVKKLDDAIEESDKLKKVKFTVPESNHTLDGVEIIHNASVDPKNRKVIVYFMGNAEIWQASLGHLETLSENNGCDVIAFNYRRCGLSSSNVDLDAPCVISDSVKIVESLTKSGVLPKNITLWGRSFGGGVAAEVAAQKSQEGTHLNVTLERTFTKLTDVITHLPIPPYFIKKVQTLMLRCNWELDTQKALGSIKGKVLIIQNKNDLLIPPAIQVQAEKPKKHVTYCMDDTLVEKTKNKRINSHDRDFTQKEYEEIVTIIKNFSR